MGGGVMQASVNQRTDKYGGPIENRVRFALEVHFATDCPIARSS